MIKKIPFLILMSLFLSSCITQGVKETLKPAKWIFKQAPKGPPEYVEGWNDGCESGLAAMTNDYYKTFYTFQQNNTLISNELYYKAWKDTFHFCRHYAYGILKEADLRMDNPEGGRHFQLQGVDRTVGYGGMPSSLIGTETLGNDPFLFPYLGSENLFSLH